MSVSSSPRSRNAVTGLLCLFSLLGVSPVEAVTPSIVWSRTYNDAINGWDYLYDAVVDPSNNVVMSGSDEASGTGGSMLVRKYSSAGDLLLQLNYNSPANGNDGAYGVATDSAGNIIAAGQEDRPDLGQGINWLLRKYDSTGTLLWTRSYNGSVNQDEWAWGIATDPADSIVVTGITQPTIGTLDWLTRKYDAAGVLLWSRTHNGPGNAIDEAWDVASDASGNSYVAGYENGGGTQGNNWRIIKYDTAGGIVWSRSYGSPASGSDDRAESIVVDPTGNVYAGGFTDRSDLGQGVNWLIVKYDPAGAVVWSRTYNSPANSVDVCARLALAPDGTLVAVGWENRSDLGQGSNWRVFGYDPSGILLWTLTHNGSSSGTDEAKGATTGPDGSIYVVGIASATGQNVNWLAWKLGTPLTPPAISVSKSVLPAMVNPGDAITYTITVSNTGASTVADLLVADTLPPAIAFTGQSNTAGLTWNGGTSVMGWSGPVTLGPGGNITITVNGTAATWFTGSVCNTGYARASNADGSDVESSSLCFPLMAPVPPVVSCGPRAVVWSRTYNDAINGYDYLYASALDPSGNLIIGGSDEASGTGGSMLVRKYDPSGNLLLNLSYNSPANSNEAAFGVASDPSGNIIAAGWEIRSDLGQGDNWLVRKYNAAGTLLWSRSWNGPGNTDDEALAVTADAAGNIYVVGYLALGPNNLEWLVAKYDAAGTVVWSRTYRGPIAEGHTASEVALDTSGNVIVVGSEVVDLSSQLRNWRIHKYDAAGNLLWSRTVGSPASMSDDRPTGVVTDASQNIYVGGWLNRSDLGQSANWQIMKYDASGALVWTRAYNGPASGTDVCTRLALDSQGELVASGYDTQAGQGNNWRVCAYDTDGTVLWTYTYNGVSNAEDQAQSVAAAPDGSLYVVGWEVVAGQNQNWRIIKLREACAPSIAVQKSVAPATANPGDAVTYTIRVTNTSSTVISDLTVVDTLPAPFVFGSQTSSPGLTWNASTTLPAWTGSGLSIGPGQTATVTITGTASSCVTATASNTAYAVAANSYGDDRKSAAVSFAVTAPVLGLTIVKTQTGGSGVGAPVGYQIVVTNTGTATIMNLVLVDTVSPVVTGVIQTTPGGFTAQAVSQSLSGSVYSWINTTPLLPGTAATFQLDGTVGAVCAGGIVSNTAYLTAATACTATKLASSASAFVLTAPILAITVVKTRTPAVPAIGFAVGYEIVVTNTGSATVDDVTVVDTVSPVVTGIVTTQPGGFAAPVVTSLAGTGTRYVWSGTGLGLAPGGTLTFRADGVAGSVCTATIIRNTAFGSAAGGCATARVLSAADSFTLSGNTPVLSAVLQAAPTEPASGEPVRYTFVVTNTGGGTATTLTVVDTLPAGVTFTGQSASAGLTWNGSGAVPAWTGPVNLAPGQSITITVDAMTSSTFKGIVTNTVWAFAVGGCGATETGVAASFTLTPPVDLGGKLVKIVGGIRGYIQPKRGEQATILVAPTTAGLIAVRIYNLRGELVRLLTANAAGGKTEVLHWDATDAAGADVPPGAYPILIEAPGVRYRDTLAVLR
ncbi:MAG: hypothetical protein AAB152_00065 [Candidatus Coatesbacteria bacterium]